MVELRIEKNRFRKGRAFGQILQPAGPEMSYRPRYIQAADVEKI
jgi:hypothetical protein